MSDNTTLMSDRALIAHEALMSFEDAFISALHDEVGICGHCGKRECAGKASSSRLPISIPSHVVLTALGKSRAVVELNQERNR